MFSLFLQGFCGWSLVVYDRLLVPSNPAIGVLRYKDNYYAFCDKHAAYEFSSAPDRLAIMSSDTLDSKSSVSLLFLHFPSFHWGKYQMRRRLYHLHSSFFLSHLRSFHLFITLRFLPFRPRFLYFLSPFLFAVFLFGIFTVVPPPLPFLSLPSPFISSTLRHPPLPSAFPLFSLTVIVCCIFTVVPAPVPFLSLPSPFISSSISFTDALLIYGLFTICHLSLPDESHLCWYPLYFRLQLYHWSRRSC